MLHISIKLGLISYLLAPSVVFQVIEENCCSSSNPYFQPLHQAFLASPCLAASLRFPELNYNLL
jgi:hypothetical protein